MKSLILLLVISIVAVQSKAAELLVKEADSLNKLHYNQDLPEKYRAIGFGISLGYGILDGQISQYFSNSVFLGVNLDFFKQRMLIQIDDYIGCGFIKKEMQFSKDLKWRDNKMAMHFKLGGNIGYAALDNSHIKVVPLAGAGIGLLTSSLISDSKCPECQPVLPYYKLGAVVDLKSVNLFYNDLYDDEEYFGLRFSVGWNAPLGKPKNAAFFNGNMLYLSIGIGGFSLQ